MNRFSLTRMIRVFACILGLVIAAACSYDDTELRDGLEDVNSKVEGLEARVAALEELCSKMNTNITALQTIVAALENNDYVTSVVPVNKGAAVIGYTISFSKSDSITIYHGEDGEDGKDGEDGYVPVIGVKLGADGTYYWTVDGKWLLDDAGEKIKAVGVDGEKGETGDQGDKGEKGDKGDKGETGEKGTGGVTPVLQIEDGYWFVSYDDGNTWKELGPAVGENGKDGEDGEDGKNGLDGDSFFEDVDLSDPSFVKFILADGTELKVPSYAAFESLKNSVDQLNANVKAMSKILDAVQKNDFVKSIDWVYGPDNEVIGYEIVFTQSGAVTIYHGKDGQDGEDGEDGKPGAPGEDAEAPHISVQKDQEDGKYYWTIDGAWLYDTEGNRVCAQGADGEDGEDGKPGADGQDAVAPQFKIEDGYWMISYDQGTSWDKLGKATGEDGEDGVDGQPGAPGEKGDSFFQDVTYDASYLYITLADGQKITLPLEAGAVNNRIASVVYLPTHEDGKSRVSYFVAENSELTISYQITPKEVVTELAENHETMLSLRSVETASGSRSFTDLEILSCEADAENGVLTLTASCMALGDAFFAGQKGASVSLSITDGLKEMSFPYVALVPEEQVVPYNEVWYTTSDGSTVSVSSTNNQWGGYYTLLESNIYERGVGKLKFSGTVEIIPIQAFSYEKKLTRVALANGVKEIKNSAFFMCSALERCVIPESVKTMSESIFAGCSAMNKYEGKYASEDGTYMVADGVLVAYSMNSPVKDFVVPEEVTKIGAYAFYHCGLTSVHIPETVTAIEQSCFLGSEKLQTVNIPSKVQKIYDVFRDCVSLQNVEIAEGIKTIDIEAFDGCKTLTEVTIPASVTKLGQDAFAGCTSLVRIYCKGLVPPSGATWMFTKNENMKIFVPSGYIYDYKNKDSYWKDYEKYIVGFDYNNSLADVDYNQCSDFYSNTYLMYVPNYHRVSTTSGDEYTYRSNFPSHTNAKHAALAFSFKLNDSSINKNTEWYLTSNNKENGLVLTQNGLELHGFSTSVSYTWTELGVSSLNDYMKIEINLIKKVFKVNDEVREYKFGTIKEIPVQYFYGEFYHDRDEGDDYDVYYGLPEGSRLYYAKAWDADGVQTYIGYKSSAQNPSTGNVENCWRWHTSTESGYDFAYYASGMTGRQTYGAGSGF